MNNRKSLYNLSVARLIGASVVFVAHCTQLSDEDFSDKNKCGWFWFIPHTVEELCSIVVFFLCLSTYLVAWNYFANEQKSITAVLQCFKKLPMLSIPTTLSALLTVLLIKFDSYHYQTHQLPFRDELPSYWNALKAGILAPINPFSGIQRYNLPLWFIHTIFYARLGTTLVCILHRDVFKESCSKLLFWFTLIVTTTYYVAAYVIALPQLVWLWPKVICVAIAQLFAGLLALWHVRSNYKIKSCRTASLMFAVSLVFLFHSFFTLSFSVMTGIPIHIIFEYRVLINAIGAIGILHFFTRNDYMVSKIRLSVPKSMTSLAYPIYFFHSQLIQTFSYWMHVKLGVNAQSGYLPVMLVLWTTSALLVCGCAFILKSGDLGNCLLKKLAKARKFLTFVLGNQQWKTKLLAEDHRFGILTDRKVGPGH